MDPSQESRLVSTPEYPNMVYLEAMVIFFGANFLFHQNVFRQRGNRLQFAAFMAANAFTSFQIADAGNLASLSRYAGIYENTREMDHRAKMTERLRLKMYQQQH